MQEKGAVITLQFQVGASCYHSDCRTILVKMLFDTAASMNLVSQWYALSMGWQPNLSLPLPETVSWGNGFSAHIYGAYEILWKATDSWGRTQEQRTVFYGAELSGHSLLLGMPGMQEQRLVVYTGDRT